MTIIASLVNYNPNSSDDLAVAFSVPVTLGPGRITLTEGQASSGTYSGTEHTVQGNVNGMVVTINPPFDLLPGKDYILRFYQQSIFSAVDGSDFNGQYSSRGYWLTVNGIPSPGVSPGTPPPPLLPPSSPGVSPGTPPPPLLPPSSPINSGAANYRLDIIKNAANPPDGRAAVGDTLIVTLVSTDPQGVFGGTTYQWSASLDGVNWRPLAGNGPNLQLTSAEANQLIRASTTYIDGASFPEAVLTASVGPVRPANPTDRPASGQPSILGSGTAGSELVASAQGINEPDGLGSVSWEWQRSGDGFNWTAAGGGDRFRVGPADAGQLVRVVATYVDGAGFRNSLTAAPLRLSTSAGLPVLQPANSNPRLASVRGAVISLQYDIELSATLPSPSRFRVSVDGRSTDVLSTAVSAGDGLISLTLAAPVAPMAAVSVSYTDLQGEQSSGSIEQKGGVDLPSFSDLKVTNDQTDTQPPAVVSASVAGTQLVLVLDEALSKDLAPPSLFTVRVDGRPLPVRTLSSEPSSGSVRLTLGTPVSFGQVVTLAYKDLIGNQTAGVIQDLAGNDLASFSDQAVENQSFNVAPLAPTTASVDGQTLLLHFDRELGSTQPSAGAFRVEADGRVVAISRVQVLPGDRQVALSLARAVTDQQLVTVSYTDPSGDQRTGVVEDSQGNDMGSLLKRAVKNDTADTNPLLLERAELDNDQVTLTFNKGLGTSLPSSSRFQLLANGRLQRIRSIEATPADGVITLNLAAAVAPGVPVQLSYNDQAGDQDRGVIEDVAGNDLTSFKGQNITNFALDSTAPTLIDADWDVDQITLYFDEPIKGTTLNASAFSVRLGRQRLRVRSAAVTEGDTVVNLKLNARIPEGAEPLVSYSDPRGDQTRAVIEDLAGNDLASLRDFTVIPLTDNQPLS